MQSKLTTTNKPEQTPSQNNNQQLHQSQQTNPHLLKTKSLFEPITHQQLGVEAVGLSATEKPQTAVYLAMHQCYCTTPVSEPKNLSEDDCGRIIVKRLLEGNRGHYSPFEQASITLQFKGVPHSVMQQLLRSRIGVSPAVQSFRYTCDHIIAVADGIMPLESLVYIRPIGDYQGRDSKKFQYRETMRSEDLSLASYVTSHAAKRLKAGMPPEQSRGLLCFDYRQHAVVTFNARSLMAVLDRRTKKDAQMEIRALGDLMLELFYAWMPIVGEWYTRNRYQKAMLSP